MSKNIVAQQVIVPIILRTSQAFEKIALDENIFKIISIVKTQLANNWKLRATAFEMFIWGL